MYMQCIFEIKQTTTDPPHLTCVVCSVGAAVVGGLRDHVRKVDSLSEHVAGHRGLGRSNPQPLTKNKQ